MAIRSARAAAAMASVVMLTFGLTTFMTASAAASSMWMTWHNGVWIDQANCETARVPSRPEENWYSYPCTQHFGDPDGRGRGPGWYYVVWADVS